VPEHAVIGVCRQAELHCAGSPVSWSRVHASPSSGQVVGQLAGGSQVSPMPTRPSRQLGAQSVSFSGVQPVGQQPSRAWHAVMRAWAQVRVQVSTDPIATSTVHASWSSHVAGHAPGFPEVIRRSQVSLALMTPSPQMTWQSESVAAVHPGGQQLSAEAQPVMGSVTHSALQVSALPRSSTTAQEPAGGHCVGHEPAAA
jgi:hypothetical protein